MSEHFPELERIRVTVGEEVRDRHVMVIGEAIRSARAPRSRRFRLLAVALTSTLLLPVVALAAENAVPGDLLYPIKRMLEPVVALVDRDVEVDHRVREAETLLERDVEPGIVRDHVQRARDVVTDEHPEHTERLDVVVDQLDHRSLDGGGDRPSTTTPEPTDGTGGLRGHGSQDQEQRQPDEDFSDSAVGGSEGTQPTSTTTTSQAPDTTRPADQRRDG